MTQPKPPEERKPRGFEKGGAAFKPPGGTGWGGPAQGAGAGPESIQNRPQFTSDDNPAGKPGPWAQRKAELAEKAMRVWESVVDDRTEATPNRIAAADKIMNRVHGLPVQHIVNSELPAQRLPDDVLDRAIAEIERALGGTVGDAEAREDATFVGKPAGIV